VREDIFKLWIDHGARLNNATYEYIVMPAATQNEVIAYTDSPRIRTIANTSEAQSVWHSTLNMGYAVFYKTGTLSFTDKIRLSSDSPAMILVCCDTAGKVKEITVSDPSRKQGRLHLRINQPLKTDNEFCSATWNTEEAETSLSVQLPQEGYEGNSVTILFQ